MRLRKWCAGILGFAILISTVFLRIRPAQTMELQDVLTDSVSNGAEVNLSTVTTGTIAASMPESTETPQAETAELSVPQVATGGTFDVQETEAVVEAVDETSATEMTEPIPDADAQEGDLGVVAGQGITFRLFNYNTDINKAPGNGSWRPISEYFVFRNSKMETGTDPQAVNIPQPSINEAHDQDAFTKHHATVERVLDGGYPVLDLSRNADGSAREDPGISKSIRSLAYLFSAGDHAVTAYTPRNTVLRQNGSHYWYNSASHAVDYDVEENRFRLRSYTERNSTTAGYGSAYGDFLPFTYTGGIELDATEGGIPYHVMADDTDYWFGMTMNVNFFQTKGGKLGDKNMIFSFSGDDDVWVFVDDVLVLDLGGTHGTVDGSINFATGEVRQYLSWRGANSTEGARAKGSDTSFPTTIRACFDAAGRTPKGGWNADGTTFADFTEHTLKFFYLERGSAVANCSLDFRLPTLPDESLTVTKDLSAESDAAVRDYIADSLSYKFRVRKADRDGKTTQEHFITAGMTYDLMENGSKTGTGTVGQDGCFALKAGQSAQFAQMLYKGNGATAYVVEEIMPSDLVGQYGGVEYIVSGAGGDTVTEENPAESFTAFRTDVLSAEQTQTVTFRNRVDTSKLGTLAVTKQAAPGTVIPEEAEFWIQVSLGGDLLPIGTHYMIGDVRRTVGTAGILILHAGETAVLEQGILSGTVYEITEPNGTADGYRPSYTATVEPAGEIECTQDGVSGTVPLAGTVYVTVTNADYDFAVQIPFSKTVLDYQKSGTFQFLAEQVEKVEEIWQVVDTLPGTRITVTNSQATAGNITIGYRAHTEGVFYYRISERHGSGDYLYDSNFYIVEVTVADGRAIITGIQKNGTENVDSISFVNRAVVALTVTKTVTGGIGSIKFPFSATVLLHGEPFALPSPAAGAGYAVNGNVISFSLAHGEAVTIPCIPIGATVTVEEMGHEGFQVFTRLEGTDEEEISSARREIAFFNSDRTLHFRNQSGFRLPNTGGFGTGLYTASGAALSSSVGASLLYRRSRKERRKRKPPEA